MLIGKFNEKLREYEDAFLAKAYLELQYLDEMGAFPSDGVYFKELARVRQELYGIPKDIEGTRKDILDEIARRWVEKMER